MTLDREAIKKILPHREPMLLLDTAEKLDDGTARGTYHVRGDEFFLQGHFPGNPVVPGVIQCEIIAQAACMLMADEMAGATPFYAGIDKVRFRRPVKPGETMEMTSRLVRHRGSLYVIQGEARVNGELCAEGQFMFALVKQG